MAWDDSASKVWMDGELVDWKDATIHSLSHVVHYGTSVFEGIRAYSNENGVAVFRLKEHVRRLFDSAKIYSIPIPYSEEEIADAIKLTVKENGLESCYIRPIVFRGYGELGVNPLNCPVNVVIAAWDWGSYLGEEVENLFDHEGIKVINMENKEFDYDCEDYGYFIVYQRNNKNEKFTPKSVSLLLKIFIKIYEVPLQPGEYSGNVEDNSYCIFELDGITQLSDESFIIAFKSRIQISRAQDSYYITDDFYKNETIYYFLNYKENRFIKLIIGKTKEKSYLFKNELDEQFYFLYNNSDKAAKSLKIYFEKYNLSLTTINVKDKLNVRNLYIEKNNIIGYNCNSIYVGKIICGELEVIYNFDLPKMQYLMHISLKNKCIYYKNQSNIIKEYNSILIEDN